MTLDKSYIELNRAATERMQKLIAHLGDEQMQTRVGEHWTVAIALAHLAWWDRRVMYVLDMIEKSGEMLDPQIDIVVNDISLPFWAAIPPRKAARIAVETAETLDTRLERYPAGLLEQIYNDHRRWVVRALHRNEHLDDVDAALKSVKKQEKQK